MRKLAHLPALARVLATKGAGTRGVEAQVCRGLSDRSEHLRGWSIRHSPADRRMRTIREQAPLALGPISGKTRPSRSWIGQSSEEYETLASREETQLGWPTSFSSSRSEMH